MDTKLGKLPISELSLSCYSPGEASPITSPMLQRTETENGEYPAAL